MIKRILFWLGPSKLRFAPEDLQMTLHYDERRHRTLSPEVESEASSAMPMMLYRAEPGKYVGLGNKVIKERRQYQRQLQSAETVIRIQLEEMIADGYVNTIHDCWEKEEKS
jgi:hypothetical protein